MIGPEGTRVPSEVHGERYARYWCNNAPCLIVGGLCQGEDESAHVRFIENMRFRYRRDAGAAAVEFAIILPLLILLVFGIVEFGQAYNRSQAMQAAVREAARFGAKANVTADQVKGRLRDTLVDGPVVATDPIITVQRFCDPLVTTPCSDSAKNNMGGQPVSGSTAACDPSTAGADTIRVDARVPSATATDYDVNIPLLPSFDMTFPVFAIFRCLPG